MEASARYYNCARCYELVLICSRCDRGNIYCNKSCSKASRQANSRRASSRYQSTRQGKLKHAARQKKYRERKSKKQKVTHHGSTENAVDDVMPTESDQLVKPPVTEVMARKYCHFCNEQISDYLRQGFMRDGFRKKILSNSSWPLGP